MDIFNRRTQSLRDICSSFNYYCTFLRNRLRLVLYSKEQMVLFIPPILFWFSASIKLHRALLKLGQLQVPMHLFNITIMS